MDQPAELGVVPLDAHADPVPEPVALAADHHVAVPAGIPLVLVEVGVPAPGSRLDAGVEAVPAEIEVEDVEQGLGAGELDELPFSAELVSPVEGRQDVDRRLLTGDIVGSPYAGPGGVAPLPPGELVLGEAGVVDEGVGALREGIELPLAVLGDPVLVGAPLPADTHPAVNEPRVDPGDLPVPRPETVHVPGEMPIDDDVSMHSKFPEKLLAFLGLDIERNGMLVPHLVDEPEAALLPGLLVGEHVLFSPEGGQIPHRVPPGRLDADHLGPRLGETRGGELVPQPPEADIKDLESLKRLRFSEPFLEPEVVLAPFPELSRLPLFVDLHDFLRRRGRRHGPRPDLGARQRKGIGPAIDFDVPFLFRHCLTSHPFVTGDFLNLDQGP